MTAPRRILKNVTYFVTRRCMSRTFFLKPSKRTNALFAYLLAVAAKRYGIVLHAACVLSDHFHCVLTDPTGRLPSFVQYLDSFVARCLNASLGRWESFWAPGSYSAVALLEPADVLDKIVYVLANPASAGLVEHGSEWPGLWSAPDEIGGAAREVTRPEGFFRENGPLPPSAILTFATPSGFASAEQFRRLLKDALAAREERAGEDLAKTGRTFCGARRILRQSAFHQARSFEPRRGLRPSLACRDRWKRMEAISRIREFLRSYRDAWRAFAQGARDTVFPAGTYWMRVAHGVRCAAAG